MKFTLSWLKQFLLTDASLEEIINALNNCGLEVESVENKEKTYSQFIVAEILETAAHPSADKLKVCKINDGSKILQVVCGAPNARAGIKVVLAPVGSIIPNGDWPIKISKIRGIESQGMLCGEDELLLSEAESKGIMELSEQATVGSNFSNYAGLDDVLIEISLTPNRGDCASIRGIARELAALGIGSLRAEEETKVIIDFENKVKVSIECKEKCREFLGTYISGVSIGELPFDINKYMRTIGSSKKLPLVDISNYMMLTYGRPNHIYDADKISGNIVVRNAYHGEKFIAIGGEEHQLNPQIMVVADDVKVLAVAGVIGGELSKVTEDTKNIFVEVADFDPISVATSGRILKINTDSRFRFERNIDSGAGTFFCNKILSTIKQCCKGNVGPTIITQGDNLNSTKIIKFDDIIIKQILGIEIPKDTYESILNKLGFIKQGNANFLVPTWRVGEITVAENLVGEIMRIYGYNSLPSKPLKYTTPVACTKSNASYILRSRGMHEVVSWSFGSSHDADIFGDSNLKLKNPISIDLSIMRSSILGNLIKFIHNYHSRGYNNISLFEDGPIYSSHYKNHQINCIAGVRAGEFSPLSPHQETRKYDFFDIKADLFSALKSSACNPDSLQEKTNCPNYYHPGKSVAYYMGKKLIAYCGMLHPKISTELKGILAFELFTDNLPATRKKPQVNIMVNNLQPVNRDFCFIVDQDIPAGNLLKTMKKSNHYVSDVNIFDIYQGKGVLEGKKSLTISIKLQPIENTFTESDLEKISSDIISAVQKNFDAELRQ